jgi:hypothetical protein
VGEFSSRRPLGTLNATSLTGSHASQSFVSLWYACTRRISPNSTAASRARLMVFGSSNAASDQERMEIDPPRVTIGLASAVKAMQSVFSLTPPGRRPICSARSRAAVTSTRAKTLI